MVQDDRGWPTIMIIGRKSGWKQEGIEIQEASIAVSRRGVGHGVGEVRVGETFGRRSHFRKD